MTLEEIRADIDMIDEEMKTLFVRRMGLSRQIALVKAGMNAPIYVPEREKEILESRSADVDPAIVDAYRSFLAHIMMLSREYQAALLGRKEPNSVLGFESEGR